jgi:hypothetical protein
MIVEEKMAVANDATKVEYVRIADIANLWRN